MQFTCRTCQFTSRDKNRPQRNKFHNRFHPDHAPDWATPGALAHLSPAEIDTELSELDYDLFKAEHWARTTVQSIHYSVGDRGEYVTRSRKRFKLTDDEAIAASQAIIDDPATMPWKAKEHAAAFERLAGYTAKVEKLSARIGELDAEFTARGGWTRAFLVLGSDGHVHRERSCHTCRITTQFGWMPKYSGKDEAEIVDDAGERACTVCYPSAPVDTLSRASRIAKRPKHQI